MSAPRLSESESGRERITAGPCSSGGERLREWRLDRLLREQLPGLRPVVLARARQRLRACGAVLEESELESCYISAWASVHARLARGGQVDNVVGLLVVLTFRRAIDDLRRRRNGEVAVLDLDDHAQAGESIEAIVADRERLRLLREAIDSELRGRERQALLACWWRGLTRAEAAAALRVPEKRVQKLMDAATAQLRPALRAIADGRWCEHRASLINAYALNVLAPSGERHRQAREHLTHCASCRARVRELRGASRGPRALAGSSASPLLD